MLPFCNQSIILSRRAVLLAVMLMGWLLFSGCPSDAPPKQKVEPKEPPRLLEIGKVEAFEFPADGAWHMTPYMTLNGQLISLRPIGMAAGLSDQALRFRVGEIPQMVNSDQPVKITSPGPLSLRVDLSSTSGYKGKLAVQIRRLE